MKLYEDVRLYEFFEVMNQLQLKYYKDFHDVMFEMISMSDQEGKNDCVHRVYRHWLHDDKYQDNKALQKLFDIICDELEIPHTIDSTGKDTTKIYFWVSW